MIDILHNPNEATWWDQIKSYFYPDNDNCNENYDRYKQNYIDKLDGSQSAEDRDKSEGSADGSDEDTEGNDSEPDSKLYEA